ncbi:MAG: NAD-dependent epimerase/dehydratase family protein, partial [Acidimicrobiales bacterium]
MRIVVTGAFGFLGRRVASTLLRTRTFGGVPIERLVLADRVVPPGSPEVIDPLVGVVHGDLLDRLDDVFVQPVDVLFHLAATVSAECEADFDLGMRVTVDTTRALLDAARTQAAGRGPVARVVFSSSLAVYGSTPAMPLPPVVSESTPPMPQSSYGTQKLICEHLIADYTRRGFLDGRVARLMTVAVRPGVPNAAASGFLSGIIREPLMGLPATCPVRPDLRVTLASPRRTVEAILRIAQVERGAGPGRWEGQVPVNLPALTVSVAEMLATLREVGGDAAASLVIIESDPTVEAIVSSWPAVFD